MIFKKSQLKYDNKTEPIVKHAHMAMYLFCIYMFYSVFICYEIKYVQFYS